MRLLFVHADHLEFEATTAVGEDVAETEGVSMDGRMDDCVTAFVTVERADATDLDAAVERAATELRDAADRLNTRKLVLYPDAHLSDDPADPDSATTAMRGLEAALEADFEVLRAPFGWHKAFEVSCKGHPLSVRSRRVTPEREGDADESAPSEWLLAFPGGETRDAVEARGDDRVSDDLRALVAREVDGTTAGASQEPPHVELLRETGLVGGDGLRWYPRGKLVRDSLLAYVEDLFVEHGAMPVETPDTFDLDGGALDPDEAAVREHAGAVGEPRDGFESSERRATTQPAACVGHLSIVGDSDVTAADLPLRLYETTDVARPEARDEAAGPERLPAATTPLVHTATSDVAQASDELRAQVNLALRVGEDLGLDYEAVIRATRPFYEDNREWVESLVADLGGPALLELLPERRGDWVATVEFATVDASGRPIPGPTARIDVESAERFGVTYDAGQEARHPVVLHAAPAGGVEHAVAALLARGATRDSPRLPTWLSPTQVRFVPVDEAHVEHCDALADALESAGVRVDVDDREASVGERIAAAETDWVPYYAVVGDRETTGDEGSGPDTLKVAVRAEQTERTMAVDELRDAVLDDVGDRPGQKRALPRHVGRRLNFAETTGTADR